MVICKLKSEEQRDIIDWAIGGMESLTKEEQIELWGQTYDDCPVKISQSNELVIETKDVAEDLLYRLEAQYISMSKDEDKDVYKKSLVLVLSLSKKIREAFEMKLITRSQLNSVA